MSELITDEIVEAAARQLYVEQPSHYTREDSNGDEVSIRKPWDWLSPEYQEHLRETVRPILAVVAPLIMLRLGAHLEPVDTEAAS